MNPFGNGSDGSSSQVASPITQALPVTVGTTAGSVPTLVCSLILPSNCEPIQDSFINTSESLNSPLATICANRALVPVPHGDLSNQPG